MKNRKAQPTYPFPIVQLSLVRDKEGNKQVSKISTSKNAADMARLLFEDDQIAHHEQFGILLLNRINNIVGSMIISTGSDIGTVVDKKAIAQAAILGHACGVILFHNHPSGNLKASEADIKVTKEVKAGLALFDINVLDHVILSPEHDPLAPAYFSFADEGIL